MSSQNRIKLGNKLICVYAGLDKSWGDTVLLGLNVLNHLIYTVERSEDSGFISLSLNQAVSVSTDSAFNRLIGADGKYYAIEFGEE